MRLIIFTLGVFVHFSYFSQVSNDDCFNALPLGTLPAPANCGNGPNNDGQGDPVTFTNLTNVGAQTESPYTTLINCQGSGQDMASPATDIWYSFVPSGLSLDITINGLINDPNVALWAGNCGNLIGAGCDIGSGGSLTTTIDQLNPGDTYYLQISGGDLNDEGTFDLTLQNNVDEHFNYANQKAGELALKAKEVSKKNILIAGSLPAQFDTYVLDERDQNLIKKDFYDQANLLKPFIDFFYLDVLSSIREIEIALNVVEKMNFPVLIGTHIRENGKLPSGETITKMVETCKNKNWLGLIASCVSPEIIENTADEVKSLDIPFGFKANLWKEQPLPVAEIVRIDAAGFGGNPVDILGSRKDINDEKFFDFSKRMLDKGATILGGCCETKPSHIKAISKLKQI